MQHSVDSSAISLHQLWDSVIPTDQIFQADQFQHLPEPTQRYLCHAIAPGTLLANAVRLKMHGEIKLKDWSPFQAEQVIAWQRGMIWSAVTWMKGLPIWGSDRVIDHKGSMRWKLLGLFPIVTATGPDITRSGLGRMLGESCWLPSVLCKTGISWTALDEWHTQATVTLQEETTNLMFTQNNIGQLEQICYRRWGDPMGQGSGYENFGGYLSQEKTFSGYTIPTQLRIGWYFGSNIFESQGEFFRATIDSAIYR
jgi:hypothetical protein